MASVKDLLADSEDAEYKTIESSADTTPTAKVIAEGSDDTGTDTSDTDDTASESSLTSFFSFFRGVSIFGICSAIAYFVISLVALSTFKNTEYAIDLREDAMKMFFLFLGCGLAPMGIIAAPICLIANIVSKWYKTKLTSLLNAFIFAFAMVLLACLVML